MKPEIEIDGGGGGVAASFFSFWFRLFFLYFSGSFSGPIFSGDRQRRECGPRRATSKV